MDRWARFRSRCRIVAALTAKGYAVASLNYRLTYRLGDHIYNAAIAGFQDAKSAVRFLRANSGRYGLDPDKFAAWGNSAGGIHGGDAWRHRRPGGRNLTTRSSKDAGVSSAVQAVVVWYGAVECRLPEP